MLANMAGQNKLALCSICYDGKIVCQVIDDLHVFYCDKCMTEVEISVSKIETFK